MEHLYLEHDGKLLLVDTEGNGPMIPEPGREISENGWKIRLPNPKEVALMGIEWTEKRRNVLHWGKNLATVIHGFPHVDWPENWAWKDSLIGDSAVHPVARESVYRTIHRLVSKVLITRDDGKIVMAKVKRGHFVGAWTLPGGYLDYSEHPKDGAIRETFEELGVEITLDEFEPIISQNIFSDEGINFVSFTYRSTVKSELDFKPKKDEIAEVEWFSKEEAMTQAVSWFDLQAIREL